MSTLDYLTKPEAALISRCSIRTIDRAIQNNRLKAGRRDGKTWIIRASDLESWLAGCTIHETAKRGRGRPPKVKNYPRYVPQHEHAA